MNDHPKNDKSPNNDSVSNNVPQEDAAVDGLLREYARTGSSGDDEQFVSSVLKNIETQNEPSPKRPQLSAGPPVQTGRPERDWPWLFGPAFWKITLAALVIFAVGIGGNAWRINQVQADPTEVMLFTRPRFAPGDDARLRVLVRNGRTKTPVANATVDVVLTGNGTSQEVATVSTDDDGIADITAELNEQLTDGAYVFRVDVAANTGEATVSKRIDVTRTFRTMLSTDKPLYQPGQTIHMRALSLNADSMSPAKQRSVRFLVRDGKGNKVFAAEPKTSDFGIAAAEFQLADQVNEGEYKIEVTVGDTMSERTVKVERYVLPKFRVDLKSDRPWYSAGDEVSVTLNAGYTFGKPTAGADVEIEASDSVAGRFVLQTVTGKTNADGLFEAKFRLKKRMAGTRANNGDAEVFFTAKVTDKTGETNGKTFSRIVAKSPIRIEVFPESGELVPNVENTLYIVTAYPDGTPAKTTVTTQGGTKVATNSVGIGKVKLSPDTGKLKLSLTARDEATGATASAVRTLRVGDAANNVLLRTDRAIYKQGETATLTVLSGSPARRAFVDIIRNGRSIATTAVDLADNAGEYAFDLPSDVVGTVQVQAYCIQPSGRIARDTKVIQVMRADQLKITAKLDAETYKPAEQAMINFLVESQDGNPVEAALSLAIVDEAVFALNDSRPGLEEMYFLIQEELLKPRYQFITQPNSRMTRDDQQAPDEFQEAKVVNFSAAEATDAEAPEKASGDSVESRENAVADLKAENQLGLVRLLGSVPLIAFAALAFLFLLYSITRLAHQSSSVDEATAGTFRSEMRLLFWMTLIALVAIPATAFVVERSVQGDSRVPISIAFAVVAVVGAAVIAAPVIRIRRLLAREQFAPLFARMVWIVPGLYSLLVLACAGTTLATYIDRESIPDFFEQALFACIGGLTLSLGCLGFLRFTLTGPRSWLQRLGSFSLHQFLAIAPVFGILMLTYMSIGADSPKDGMAKMVRLELPAPRVNLVGGTDAIWFANEAADAPMMMAEGAADWDSKEDSGLAFDGEGRSAQPRVRKFFPETLLWQPQLLTDSAGKATLNVTLADSITTWRMAGSAVSQDGSFGSFQQPISVFQDFFVDIQVPAKLTQNDEVALPIAIFNYLNKPQRISLEIAQADWFEFVDDQATKSVEANAGEVLKSSYRIRVLKPGQHAFTVKAKGSVLADAVERVVRVVPDGERVEFVANAKLKGEASETIRIPQNAVAGGSDLYVKLYPGGFSQVIEGMDSIFQMPHGCFEQTSSTTYPNILVLDYLRSNDMSSPEIEMKALDFIAMGYQRLLSFEVDGGGYDWFGNPPANEVLTAYGLHEFTDMAKVYDVDADMVARTRDWLIGRMKPDGTWQGEDLRHERVNDATSKDRTIRQTAYVLWALARTGDLGGLETSLEFLEQCVDTEDPYVLAILANALLACDRDRAAQTAVARLSDMAQEDGETAHWTSQDSGLTYSSGNSLSIETTALVIQAFLKTNEYPELVSKGLNWLTTQRDGRGTWHSTQATVQAMRSLLMAETGGTITKETTINIAVNGELAKPLIITEETGDIFHLVSLTELVQNGDNTVSLSVDNDSLLAYQIVGVHYIPTVAEPADRPNKQILEIETNYGQRELSVDDLLTVKVTLKYNRPEFAPMTLVDLGIPPGFEIDQASFRKLINNGVITKFEPKGQQVSLYFNRIPGNGEPTEFEYQLKARFPVKVKAPGNVAYQYYEPEIRAESPAEMLTVR